RPDPGVRPGRDRCTVQPLRRHGGLRRRSVAGRQQLSHPGRPGDGGARPVDRADRGSPLRCGTDGEASGMTDRCDVVVIGAGIAGLTAASVLAGRGQSVTVLEARDRVGGRLHSVPVEGGVIEAGATWFWDNEPLVRSLADQLGLSTYPQHLAGDALWEGPAVQRLDGNPIDQPAERISAGAQQLAAGLAGTLPTGALRLSSPVTALSVSDDGVRASVEPPEAATGHAGVAPATATTGHVVTASQAILAVPPALAVEQIQLTPALPAPLRALAESTPVWMGEMVKAVACYQEPFWRAEGLSGSAISHAGPFRELHDHCGPDGTPAAVFAFAPAASLAGAARAQVAELFTAQLVRLFGPRARDVSSVHVVDWSQEQYTQPASTGSGSS